MSYIENVVKRRKLFHKDYSQDATFQFEEALQIQLPASAQPHALAVPPCSSHLFIGGADGYVRKYSVADSLHPNASAEARSLSVPIDGQKTPILLSYFDTSEPDNVDGTTEERTAKARFGPRNYCNPATSSAIHSLAIQDEEVFGVCGTKHGNISLFTIRHDEGQIRHIFKSNLNPKLGHTPNSPVGAITLEHNQTGCVSGDWQGRIISWDLNTGQVARTFDHAFTQVTALSFMPSSAINAHSPAQNIAIDEEEADADAENDTEAEADGESDDALGNSEPNGKRGTSYDPLFDGDATMDTQIMGMEALESGLTLPEQIQPIKRPPKVTLPDALDETLPSLSADVLLGSVADGRVLVWDKRATIAPVRSLELSKGTPPWASCARWSVDGQSVFVGRRDATVDLYDIRSHSRSQHSFTLPPSSGAASALEPLKNGRHLIVASWDCLRIYDVAYDSNKKSPYKVASDFYGSPVAGLCVDPQSRYIVTALGNRDFISGKASKHGVRVSILK